MGRRRKMLEEKIVEDPELARIVAALQASGGGAEYFYEIRRRAPGVTGYFPIWKKKVPCADVIEPEEFCRSQGGPGYEYLVILKDAALKTVLDKNDIPVQQRFDALPVPGGPQVAQVGAPRAVAVAPEITDKLAAAARIRQEAEADAELDSARRAAERTKRAIERGQDEDEDERPGRGGRGPGPGMRGATAEWPFGPGVAFYVDSEGMARRMNERGRPEDRDNRRGDSMEMFMQLMAQMNDNSNRAADRQMQLMAGMMNQKNDGGLEKYLPLLLGQQMNPEKMMSFMGPVMAETMKASASGMKSVLESALENNAMISEIVIKRLADDGRDPDEVDRVKKWMDLGNDFLSRATKTVLGRDSIMKEVKIPLGDPKGKALPPPQENPALLAPPANGQAKAAPAPAVAKPAPAPAAPVPDLELEAKEESERRVRAFLGIFEREMRIGSDPAPLFDPEGEAGKQFWNLFDLLPLPLRAAIEKGDMAGIYTAAQEYAADGVERINQAMSDPVKGETRRDWSRAFWLAIAEANKPDEDDDEDDDDVQDERKAE